MATKAGLLTQVRYAIQDLEMAGHRPDTVLLNPADLKAMADNGDRIWGLKAVVLDVVPVGDVYVFDSTAVGPLYDRAAALEVGTDGFPG